MRETRESGGENEEKLEMIATIEIESFFRNLTMNFLWLLCGRKREKKFCLV